MELIVIFVLELILLFFLSRFLTKSLSHLFFRVTKSKALTIQLLSFLFLPGVVVHELAHLLVAGILFVPVGEIEFLPQITEGGVKLGSIGIGKTDPIRRSIIGFAPVIVGLLIMLGALFYLVPSGHVLTSYDMWKLVGLFYTLFVVSNTMFSSKKDVEGTVELLLAFGFVTLIFYAVGVRIDFSFASQFISSLMSLIAQVNLFLLAPITVDVVIVGLIRTFSKQQ